VFPGEWKGWLLIMFWPVLGILASVIVIMTCG
jgi:hypothetical protein